METPGDPPPEGQVIEEAREKRRLSQNKAAEQAGLSGTRWRQIVTGVASGGKGIQIPVHGRAETVARMAQVVGVAPEQLAEVGRDDAAEVLRTLAATPEEPNRDLAEQLAERLRWIEEDNARRQRENEERIRRLEDEVRRLGGQSG